MNEKQTSLVEMLRTTAALLAPNEILLSLSEIRELLALIDEPVKAVAVVNLTTYMDDMMAGITIYADRPVSYEGVFDEKDDILFNHDYPSQSLALTDLPELYRWDLP